MVEERRRATKHAARCVLISRDESGHVAELIGREDQDHTGDWNRVGKKGDDARDVDRERDVFLRVLHLLAGVGLELEADPLEDDYADDPDQDRRVRREEATDAAVEPVLNARSDDQDREEGQQSEPDDGAEVRHPLHIAKRQDVHRHGDPDEQDADHRLGELVATEAASPEGVQSSDGCGSEGAAQPDRVAQPIKDSDHRAGEVPVCEANPVIGRALGREGGAQLGGDQSVGNEEGQAGHDEPEDGLGAVRRRLADSVQGHDRADREEDHVEAEERLFELAFLGYKLGYGCGIPHALPSPKLRNDEIATIRGLGAIAVKLGRVWEGNHR